MSSFSPLVSIIIPVYNGSDYLREAIDSALAQSYGNIEILVVNDGSRDEGKTEAIAISYGDKIRYIPKQNGGVASALNLGIREMTGEYFTWLSHDDLYYPAKTEEQVRLLEEAGGDAVVYSDYEYIDPSGNYLGTKMAKSSGVKYSLIMEGTINGCTVMIPRRYFDEIGLFDLALRTTQDFDMWFRLAEHYPFLHQAKVLVKSRVHPNQGSLTIPTHIEEQNDLYVRTLGTFEEKDLPDTDTMASFYLKAAIRFVSMGCNQAADHSASMFWSAFQRDCIGKRLSHLALFAVYRLLRTAYRSTRVKKIIKRANKILTSFN
uniref:Glycosyl transferase family 2 n=1 Tax=Geobacter sp. (strain M21) TaxID=443144 RepID=C6E5K3_GEOSM